MDEVVEREENKLPDNVIVLGKDTEDERRIELVPIKGTKNLKVLSQLVESVSELEGKVGGLSDSSSMKELMPILTYFWNNEVLLALLPFAFQMHSQEDLDYLENKVDPVEIIFTFLKAANYVIAAAFGGAEVEEAMGK